MMASTAASAAEYKPIYTKQREWENTGTGDGEIKVFRPTPEEFANFGKYVELLEQQHVHWSSGICKVIPPPGWHPRPSKNPSDYSDIDDFIIECPVKERMEGGSSTGCYVKNNTVYRKEMRVADFRRMALSKQFKPPKPDDDLKDLERYFWRNLLHHEPLYGADTPGSIYDADVRDFNMNRLGTILDLLKEQEITIKGVNTVFLYFGMWKTMFPWHAEDMDLYSINYLHFGEPKFWYAIPPQAAKNFERLAAQRFPDGPQICKAFLRHKVYVISPYVLRTHGIPYGTMVQYPGEFIITFPKGYHMGFNLGFNCAESTNFALERWIDYGKIAELCCCRKDGVEIDMRPFMQKYRPDEYKEWFDYWYGERPSSCNKPKRRKSERMKQLVMSSLSVDRRNSDAASTSGRSSCSSEDIALPMSCTKLQKAIFKARKPMRDLWSNKPVNLFAEKQHNTRCALLYPHCSVCQYFVKRELWTKAIPVEKLPERSKRFLSDQMFEKECRIEENLNCALPEDQLLECANCQVVVHADCYPSSTGKRQPKLEQQQSPPQQEQKTPQNELEKECECKTDQQNGEHMASSSSSSKLPAEEAKPQQKQAWLCERCSQCNDVLIRTTSCSLCELRGGALLETSRHHPSGQGFMHVICAIMDAGTRFLQPVERRSPCSSPSPRLMPQLPADCCTSNGSCSPAPSLFSYNNSTTARANSLPPLLATAMTTINNSMLADSGITADSSADTTLEQQISQSEYSCISTSKMISSPSPAGSLIDALPQLPPLLLPNSPVGSASPLSIYSYSSNWPHQQQHQHSANSGCASPAALASQAAAAPPPLLVAMASVATSRHCSPAAPSSAFYQCEVCGQQSEHLIRCAECVQEDEMGAKLRFHVTCAPLADVTFERSSLGARAVCAFHHSGQDAEEPASIDERRFETKQRVVVDLSGEEEDEARKERMIGYGQIQSITEHLFATVDFMDGSSSSDIFPSDIFDCECKQFGCSEGKSHLLGSLVYVNWSDDMTYQAYYRGQNPLKKYHLKLFPPLSFELKDKRKRGEEVGGIDGEKTVKDKKRDDEIEVSSDMFYRRDDVYPEHVRQALHKRNSTSTETTTSPSKKFLP